MTAAAQAPDEQTSARLQRRHRRSLVRRVFGTRLLITFAVLLTVVTVVVFGVAGLVKPRPRQLLLPWERGDRISVEGHK